MRRGAEKAAKIFFKSGARPANRRREATFVADFFFGVPRRSTPLLQK
jgi:hypothetical protein